MNMSGWNILWSPHSGRLSYTMRSFIHNSQTQSMKVAELLLQTLERAGVTRIFGNPGTTELPLVKACEQRSRIKYIVALSEVSAVPIDRKSTRLNSSHT